MKKIILLISLVFSLPAFAGYTYVIDSYGPVPDLYGTESLLMIEQGGDNMITLWDNSSAKIVSTSVLKQGFGGIQYLTQLGNSYLDFSGGEIYSNQSAWKLAGDPPVSVWNPHITIVYSGALPVLNLTSHVLTGLWGNGTNFSIYLPNITGYSPAIDNIKFTIIPEPASLILLAVVGLLVRKRKGRQVH